MARSWNEVRSEVVTDEAQVAAHRANLDAEVRAFRLAEIRRVHALTPAEAAGFGDRHLIIE